MCTHTHTPTAKDCCSRSIINAPHTFQFSPFRVCSFLLNLLTRFSAQCLPRTPGPWPALFAPPLSSFCGFWRLRSVPFSSVFLLPVAAFGLLSFIYLFMSSASEAIFYFHFSLRIWVADTDAGHSFDCANHQGSEVKAIWHPSRDPLINLPSKYCNIQSRDWHDNAFIEL